MGYLFNCLTAALKQISPLKIFPETHVTSVYSCKMLPSSHKVKHPEGPFLIRSIEIDNIKTINCR